MTGRLMQENAFGGQILFALFVESTPTHPQALEPSLRLRKKKESHIFFYMGTLIRFVLNPSMQEHQTRRTSGLGII